MMAFNPFAQGYANAYRTQMDQDMNQAVQNGLLALNYKPAAQQPQVQVSPLAQQGEQTLFQRLQSGENWNSVMGK